eukprot:3931933-Rhodomonas_salina.1
MARDLALERVLSSHLTEVAADVDGFPVTREQRCLVAVEAQTLHRIPNCQHNSLVKTSAQGKQLGGEVCRRVRQRKSMPEGNRRRMETRKRDKELTVTVD